VSCTQILELLNGAFSCASELSLKSSNDESCLLINVIEISHKSEIIDNVNERVVGLEESVN
jgi:hypothetical protein